MNAASARRGVSTVGLSMPATARIAAIADAAGLDAWTSETYARSGMVSLAAIAAATERATIGSSILYGVGRTPVVLAADTLAVDELSGGRLLLGLGNGTKGMLERWHGVDPAAPAVRMEELVGLLRALWKLHEGPVEHAGRFYSVAISPTGAIAPPLRDRIPVYTGGINPRMIEAAGRVADGLVGHPLFGLRYIEEIVRPAIARGAERAERDPAEIGIAHMVICLVDEDEERGRREAAAQIALYAATKTYAPMLDVPGFGRQGEQIRAAFAARDLAAMVAAVNDEMIDALAVVGTAERVAAGLRRYDGVVESLIAYVPNIDVPEARIGANVEAVIEALSGTRRDGTPS